MTIDIKTSYFCIQLFKSSQTWIQDMQGIRMRQIINLVESQRYSLNKTCSLIKGRTYFTIILFFEISTSYKEVFLIPKLKHSFHHCELLCVSSSENVLFQFFMGLSISPDLIILALTYCYPVLEVRSVCRHRCVLWIRLVSHLGFIKLY